MGIQPDKNAFHHLCTRQVSTGLDSAATFDIVRAVTMWTRKLKLVSIFSLLQPQPETMNEFDDVRNQTAKP